ncbi:hypothetical protein OWS73_17230 [Burkholderia sp. 1B3(2022)]|uniref:hypothetical protein n=1 Tax=Burkholderia sp. 1B3(2022) TaxID=2997425 RepID=UPI002FC71EBC
MSIEPQASSSGAPLPSCVARSFSCIYQRADTSATVAMTMCLAFFSEAIGAMEHGAGTRRRGKRYRRYDTPMRCNAADETACRFGDVAHTTSGCMTSFPDCEKILFMGLSNASPAHRGGRWRQDVHRNDQHIGRQ